MSKVLFDEIAAAIHNYQGAQDPSWACVLGIETMIKERWRVWWFQPGLTPGVLLFLVTLRSNYTGLSFDVQVALHIACWRVCSCSPSSVFTSVRQLVGEFDQLRGSAGSASHRSYREIQVGSVPLPFSDPWDRLWVSEAAPVRQVPRPGGTLLVWQHGDALYLVIGWNSALSAALVPISKRIPQHRSSPEVGHRPNIPAAL